LEPADVLIFLDAGAAVLVFADCGNLEELCLVDFAVTLWAGETFFTAAEVVLPLGFLDLGVDINPQQVGCWC